MLPSRANPHWTFTLWLTFQRHRKGEIGNVARFVENDETWRAGRNGDYAATRSSGSDSSAIPGYHC